MHVQCPQCGAGGNIPDAKIPPSGTKIVCPKCKAPFFVQNQPSQVNTGQDAATYYQVGMKFLQNKQLDAAIQQFELAIQANPQSGEAYKSLGLAYGQKKLWAEAVQSLQQAVRCQPDDIQTFKNLGIAYLQEKKFTEAIQALEKVLQKTPEDEKAKSYLVMAVEGHQQDLAAAKAQTPATLAEPLAESLEDLTAAATQATAPPLQHNPVQELLDKGAEYINNAQYTQAIEAFQEVCRIDPHNSDGYFGLAMTYEKRKEEEKAIEAYEKVLELNPNDNLAKENLKFLKKQDKKFHLPWKK